jgi:ABC-2 type transport system permease protein
MKALAIAGSNLRRVGRDRTALFFMAVFPFLIILAIGAVFGSGFIPVLGVVGEDAGPLGRELVTRLERTEGIEVRSFEDRATLTDAVERGQVEAGLVVPTGYDAAIRAGETVEIPYLARPTGAGQETRLTVAAAIDRQAIVLRAARFAEAEGVASFEDARGQARALAGVLPRVTVRSRVAGGEAAGAFDYGAAQQMVLFMFVISLAASSMMIETRRLGLSRRMLSTPTAAGTVLAGEALGRFGIALAQGLVIVTITLVLFGVDWGDPLATAAIVVLFGVVGTGAAMLMGSVFRNAQQAGTVGVFVGLAFAALGGAMVPLEIYPDPVRVAAHATPHAWALDAFAEVLGRGGGVGDVLPQLGVLAAYGAVLLAIATQVFRRRLTA